MKLVLNDPKTYLYALWLQAIAAMLGSLYFSEVLRFEPCALCWYQRIFVYPIVFLVPVGLYLKDKHISKYILVLIIPGLLISIYQNLLQYGLISVSTTCLYGTSCTILYINYLGFITIPLLSLLSYFFILVCAVINIKLENKSNVQNLN